MKKTKDRLVIRKLLFIGKDNISYILNVNGVDTSEAELFLNIENQLFPKKRN